MRYRVEKERSRGCRCCGRTDHVIALTVGQGEKEPLRICVGCWTHIVPNVARVQGDPDPQAAIDVLRY